MLDLRQQTKAFRNCKPLHALNNCAGFIDQHHFITKSGHVGGAIRIDCTDAENLEPERLDAYTAQLTSALKLSFDEDFVVTSYVSRRSNPLLSSRTYGNKILDETVKNHFNHLKKRGSQIYSLEVHLVVTCKTKWSAPRLAERLREWALRPRKALRESVRVASQVELLDEKVTDALKKLDHALNSFLEQSSGAITARILDKKETFLLMRRLANPNRAKAEAVILSQDTHTDYWVMDSQLECYRGHLRADDEFIKCLTLKRPPAQTFAHMLRGLHRVQSEMVIVTEWQVCESSKAVADIRSRRAHWHKTKTSLWSQVGSERPYERELLIDNSKEALVDSLGELLRDIEMNGVRIGFFSLTVTLFGSTLDTVDRAAAEVMRVFGIHEGALNEERYNGLNAFIATLPGGYPFNLRRMLVTNRNHADLCCWFLPSEGDRRDEFLRRECLIPLETEDQTLYYLALHPRGSDVGHQAVIGPTGSGKSFLLNFFITHVQIYNPYTFIFGFGGDFRWLTELFGGSYLQCRPDRQPFKINPFILEPTPKNLEFLFAFVKLLTESHDFKMTATEERDTFDAIRSLYVLEPEQRRLLTLSTTVCKRVGDRLRRWTEGEQYGVWFDNAEDTVTFNRLQYLDFEGMDKLGPVLEAMLFYLLYRSDEIIRNEAESTDFKVFFVDEAWRLFRHPVTRTFIIEALKTWRKKNAAMILATQSVEDLDDADLLGAVVESCPTKVLLSNPNAKPQVYGDILGLTPTEQERVKHLTPKGQFLLKREGLSKVLNLNVDPKSYWLFTTDPFEAKHRQELIDRIGLHAALDELSKEAPK